MTTQNSTVEPWTAWDGIITTGWGPGFAAGSILSELRPPAIPDNSPLATARWYYRELVAHASKERTHGPWTRALAELWEWLTPAEHQALMAEDARPQK
jgi:hypothetical protein